MFLPCPRSCLAHVPTLSVHIFFILSLSLSAHAPALVLSHSRYLESTEPRPLHSSPGRKKEGPLPGKGRGESPTGRIWKARRRQRKGEEKEKDTGPALGREKGRNRQSEHQARWKRVLWSGALGFQGCRVRGSPHQREKGVLEYPGLSPLWAACPPSSPMLRRHHGKRHQPPSHTVESSCRNQAEKGARGRRGSFRANAQNTKNGSG